MLSEDQETDFENLILCGRNKSEVFHNDSSKFSGGNEIRRSPTSTPRAWTSTRDPFVRRLTFYDASRTLLEEKKRQEQQEKLRQWPQVTFTRTVKKMTTKSMSTTTTRPKVTRSPFIHARTPTKYDSKKSFGKIQTTTR